MRGAARDSRWVGGCMGRWVGGWVVYLQSRRKRNVAGCEGQRGTRGKRVGGWVGGLPAEPKEEERCWMRGAARDSR